MKQQLPYNMLIKEALSNYVSLANKRPYPCKVFSVFDDATKHYLVMEVGWHNKKRVQHIILHVALRDGKIWIEEDWTEDGVASYFLEHKVPNEQIVLGFQAPHMRQYTEFAVG